MPFTPNAPIISDRQDSGVGLTSRIGSINKNDVIVESCKCLMITHQCLWMLAFVAKAQQQ